MRVDALKLHGAWLGLRLLSVVNPTLRRAGASRGVQAALAWMRSGERGLWPTVESLHLEVELSPPGSITMEARMELSGVRGAAFGLLLNRDLEVEDATDDEGRGLFVLHALGLPGRHHSEARIVLFCMREPPPSGRTTVRLRYGGRCACGRKGPDWRGILLVDESQVRMTEQSVFYPAVPHSADGPSLERTFATLRVQAPPDFEVAAPGRMTEERPRWTFEPERRGQLCLVAGRFVRHEVRREGLALVVLLRSEHAELAPRIAAEVEIALEFYRAWLGELETCPVPITVVEIDCRPGSSYNWASEGVIAIDRRALRDELPLRSLAHELAHLWWGIGIGTQGEGERILTESTSEYACWRFLEHRSGPEALASAEELARERVATLHRKRRDVPLRAVTARTPGYADLVHAKGPLALRHMEQAVGRTAFDAALRAFVRDHRESVATLDDFIAEIRRAAGDAAPGFAGIDQ